MELFKTAIFSTLSLLISSEALVIISAVSADQDSTEATVCMYTSVQHHNAIINIMLLELLQCTAKGIS